MANLPKYAIIVAGGSGTRMGGDTPKQFLSIGGMPILMHTLNVFHSYDVHIHIILVLPQNQIEKWKVLCMEHQFAIPHQIVEGGKSRFQSVNNALHSITETEGLVAIHDGVRPFVSTDIIHCSFDTAARYGNAITSVPLKDSIRMKEGNTNKAVDRTLYTIIQTPQTFQVKLIKKAFETPELTIFTDDASVLEYMGEKINLIEGSYNNIKITTQEDLILAETILLNKLS